ncbi:amino acid ABC transporter permease [Erysipelothrix sp. strain 2 (EsS2-6-Brazil)]|uniref:amino acid ABC transporter permease n=1 Tax=Erysipelothrix sp. strain 2 (EsS2-6-Brazil) TaxID=2500549 RepID=UPI0013779C2B|nr:amino acid ABC transporter permease [Erysipelothrix sp. strain 2 (EsS2-6-Brazil)]MBK2402048.1 amino acid ABC transporter permease [Erysipelothrix sp. strain 2 (EsS2-6-Brazil)]NBA01071.1 ABC transporter permease subunit [Erysipelothrix rhusiopathiae]
MFQDILKLINRYGHVYLKGAWGTLTISVVVVLISTLLGAFLAMGKMSKFKPLKAIINVYIEVIRGTPLLLQLSLFYFLGSEYISSSVPDVGWIMVALIINSSAYVAEIFRAGIQAVDKGQFEAAKSLGISNTNMMKKIIFPQAIKNILPALGNEFITMIKETSLASVFFVNNLMTSESIVSSATHLKLPSLMIVGVIYFMMTFSTSKLISAFERKVALND